MWNDFAPSFDPEGDYLYFVADRMFQPQLGSFEFNYLLDRESYLYAVALRDDVAHPFPPRSDTLTFDEDGDEDEEGADPDADSPSERKRPARSTQDW